MQVGFDFSYVSNLLFYAAQLLPAENTPPPPQITHVTTSHFSSEEFWTNPQYRLKVKALEEWSEGDKNVLLSLLQKPDEEYRSKVEYHHIGFLIYKVSDVLCSSVPDLCVSICPWSVCDL